MEEGAEPVAIGFSTKMRDGETDLLYYGYRWYDPVTGRWPSGDPLGDEAFYRRFVQGMSQSEHGQIARRRLAPLYLMIGNDPISRWDLPGLCDCGKIQIREIGGAGGGGGSEGMDWLFRPKYWNKGNWKDAPPDPDASLNLPRSATAVFQIQVVDSTCDKVKMTVNSGFGIRDPGFL